MKNIFILVFLFISISLFSQNISEFRSTIYSGIVAPNYSKAPSIKPGYAFEISQGKHLRGAKEWHQYYNYPTYYLSLFMGYPGNKEYGYFVGFMPQLLFDNYINNKFDYNVRMGVGIAYHTNPYDVTDNPLNMMVGSAIIAMGTAEFGLVYKLNDNNKIGTAISIIHFSNGHCQLPNIGMNFPALNINYRYSFIDSDNKDEIIYTTKKEKDKLHFFFGIAAGMHEFGASTKPVNGLKYLVHDYSFGLLTKTSPIHKFSAGVNLMYYNSFNKFIVYQELDIGNTFIKSTAVNIFIGHEFMFGRFGFYSEIALDIYKPFYRYQVTMYGDKFGAKDIIKSINSNKMGIRYTYIKAENFAAVAGINLKVNMAQADFIEIYSSFEF